ncbi:MAG: metallophosphoesterase [Gammaproteobacteria bacterium]|jgi:predicted MPP superfamily phosphohydrolase
MVTGEIEAGTLRQLQARVGKTHLRQRLGLETAHMRRVFGQGRTLVHIENLIILRSIIRNSLRVMLLHGRARRNARLIQVRHNDIAIPGLPGAFENFTILQLSDLHLDIAPDMPHVLGEVVRQVEYDLCVLTGDYRAETWGPYEDALAGLQQLRAQLGETVYGILGNHDSICMLPAIEAMGIRILLNEQVTLERGGEHLYLAGIDDPHFYRADNLEKAADDIPDDAISILLAHSPEIYRHAAHADFNLMLCGHTHGGQICLPGGIPLMCNAACPRAYCAGAWRYLDMPGYTSAGSGVCAVDVRLNCPPEITLHHLHGA